MTHPTLAALGDDPGGPLHISRPSGHADASPDVLPELHARLTRSWAGPPAAAARRLATYRDARSMYDDVSMAALTAFGIPELIDAALTHTVR